MKMANSGTSMEMASPCNDLKRNETFSGDLPERTRARYESLASLMLLGGSLAEACRFGGISRTSLYRLMRREDFRRVLAELREHQLAAVRAGLAQAAEDALEMLTSTVRDKAAPLALRLRAAIAIMNAVTDETTPRPPIQHQHLHAHLAQKEGSHE